MARGDRRAERRGLIGGRLAAGGRCADHGGMPGGAPDPWGAAGDPEDRDAEPRGDLLEGGLQPPWWHRTWTALPRRSRRLVVGVGVVLALAAGGLWLHDQAAERALARRVDLAASLAVSGDSRTPAGGQVSIYVVVRNNGPLPVRITSVEGGADGVRLGTPGGVDLQVPPGGEASVPVSVRLTCDRYTGGEGLTAAVALLRADGGSVTRELRPRPAAALTDVATTLCAVRPDLRDAELSGPVLSAPAG